MSGIEGPRRRHKLTRLLERDGNRCHWCHRTLGPDLPPTFEHLIPRHYGGRSDDDNLVLACAPCNSSRNHHVRCTSCGNRVRRGGIWIDRTDPYHPACLPLIQHAGVNP